MGFALTSDQYPRYTYEDYRQWEGRWEIIDGVPYAMSPQPSGRHQWICGQLFVQFQEALRNCTQCGVSLPMDWKMEEGTVVQPDLFVACFPFRDMPFITDTPQIVVEVLSSSTRQKDLTVKHGLYLDRKVRYYVIIDPSDGSHTIHQLSEGAYIQVASRNGGTFTFTIEGGCNVSIDFDRLWE